MFVGTGHVRRLSVLGSAATVLCLAVSGCGSRESAASPVGGSVSSDSAALRDPTPEKATARGLVAAILTHVDVSDVVRVGVAKADTSRTLPPDMEHGPGYVSVDLKGGTSIGLLVTDYVTAPAPFTCAADLGYDKVQCQDSPFFRYIGKVDPGNEMTKGMPDYEGRTRDAERGEVLVQIRSTESQDSTVALIGDLLDDPNLGMRTTAALNARGAALEHVADMTITGTREETK